MNTSGFGGTSCGQAAPAPVPAALTPELVQQLHSNGVSARAPTTGLGIAFIPIQQTQNVPMVQYHRRSSIITYYSMSFLLDVISVSI